MAKKFILSQIYSCFGTVLEPDQLPGSWVPRFLQLPSYGYPVPDKPNVDFNAPELNAVNVSQDLREFNLKSLE